MALVGPLCPSENVDRLWQVGLVWQCRCGSLSFFVSIQITVEYFLGKGILCQSHLSWENSLLTCSTLPSLSTAISISLVAKQVFLHISSNKRTILREMSGEALPALSDT